MNASPDGLSTAVHGIHDPAIVVDEEHRIVAWNPPAEQLLGHAAEGIEGRPCHEVLCGLDELGNVMCERTCMPTRKARRGEPIASFGMRVRRADGETARVAVSVLVLPDGYPPRQLLIHIFHPLGERPTT